ncbi:MAG: hypothetical protein K9K35_10505 [Rhodoferax sp.]|nr:hypothetical protein [Rhodoferax sp.]
MKPNIKKVLDSLRGRGIQSIGLPWYERGEWVQARAVMEDGHSLARTYGEWEANAKELEQALRGEGYAVVRAHIRPLQFVAWCRANGHNVNSEGRNAFANWCAMKGDGEVH